MSDAFCLAVMTTWGRAVCL